MEIINTFVPGLTAFKFGSTDELARNLAAWMDTKYLYEFFEKQKEHLTYFKVISVKEAVNITLREVEHIQEKLFELTINGDKQLSANALALVTDEKNERWISPASIWEMAIKVNLGKLQLNRSFPDLNVFLSTNKFLWLPIEFEHAVKSSQLPQIHRDPFDRMLIAQALTENLAIVSKDPNMGVYGVEVVW